MQWEVRGLSSPIYPISCDLFCEFLFADGPQPVQSSSAAEEGQVSDQDAQEGAGQDIAGPVDIEVEAGEGDERRQGDGGIAKAPVRLGQDRGGDDRGERSPEGKE